MRQQQAQKRKQSKTTEQKHRERLINYHLYIDYMNNKEINNESMKT